MLVPSPRRRRITFDAVPLRLRLLLVLTLRVSSCIGKPGIPVLIASPSMGEPDRRSEFRDVGGSGSLRYVGIFDMTGAMEMRGAAGRRAFANAFILRSFALDATRGSVGRGLEALRDSSG